jgi:hypothetical protein
VATVSRPPLRPLSEFAEPPETPTRLLPAVLILTAVIAAVSMPLPWHHRVLPGPFLRIVVVRGIDVASWLIVIAVICILAAARFAKRRPGFFGRWFVPFVAFATAIGVYADYLDAQGRSGALNMPAYMGPGFYLGVGLVPVLIVAAVLSVRHGDSL